MSLTREQKKDLLINYFSNEDKINQEKQTINHITESIPSQELYDLIYSIYDILNKKFYQFSSHTEVSRLYFQLLALYLARAYFAVFSAQT